VASTSPSANTPWRSPISELRYTAYGEERYASGETPTGYRYTGQLSKLDTTGLYYYGARWYDPAIMAFASADTLIPDPGNPLDWNRYMYARGNSIRLPTQQVMLQNVQMEMKGVVVEVQVRKPFWH